MGTWVVIATFEYARDKTGNPYGWGIARYITPEFLLGKERIYSCNHRTPEESKQLIVDYLIKALPQASEKQILKLIG